MKKTSTGWAYLAVLMLACSGCEIGRTMFQMDSDSPVPRFSFDLLPSKKKDSSPLGSNDRSPSQQGFWRNAQAYVDA